MARVLAAGGFPEEALPLTAKAIGIGAAARLAALGELPAGVSSATPAQMRELVDRGAFASQAEAALSALWSPAGGRGVGDIISLIDNATLVVAGIKLTENGQRPHEMKVGRGRPDRAAQMAVPHKHRQSPYGGA